MAADWIFSVQDNDIGIELQSIERIFLVLQRLHRRDEYPGRGIGLAIAKKTLAATADACDRIRSRDGIHILFHVADRSTS